MSEPERIWLVDDNDLPVGEGWQYRSFVPRENWQNFRTVYAFVRNRAGAIWFPFRTANRPIFPSCYDFGVAGHVKFKEGYLEALMREAVEELRLDVEHRIHSLLGYFNPRRYNISSWAMVWEISAEDVPNYDQRLFLSGDWMMPAEFRERMNRGVSLKPDLSTVFDLCYPFVT